MQPFTWVDLALGLVIALAALEGGRRGLLSGLLDLFGYLLSLGLALALYLPISERLAPQIGLSLALTKPVAFAGAWLIAALVFQVVTWPLHRVWAPLQVGPLRALGIVPGVARGLVVALVLVTFASALPLPDAASRAIAESAIGGPLSTRGAPLARAFHSVFGDAAQQTLDLLTVRPSSEERIELPFRVAEPQLDPAAEQRMVELVNRERVAAGLLPLRVDPGLTEAARAHSVDMLRRGYFSHLTPEGRTPAERVRAAGVRFQAAGENIALAPNVEVAHRGLMDSPGHRSNVLNPRFGRIGVGVADGGLHGEAFTQEFAD